jgi:hypothetical protein
MLKIFSSPSAAVVLFSKLDRQIGLPDLKRIFIDFLACAMLPFEHREG